MLRSKALYSTTFGRSQSIQRYQTKNLISSGFKKKSTSLIIARSVYIASRQSRRSSNVETSPSSSSPSLSFGQISTNSNRESQINKNNSNIETEKINSFKAMLDSFATEYKTSDNNSVYKNLQIKNINKDQLPTRKPDSFNSSDSTSRLRFRRRRRVLTQSDREKSKEIEQQIIQIQRFSKELKNRIRVKDEQAVQDQKLKEAQEKHVSPNETKQPPTNQSSNLLPDGSSNSQDNHHLISSSSLDQGNNTLVSTSDTPHKSNIESTTLEKDIDTVFDFLDLSESEAKAQLEDMKSSTKEQSIEQVKKSFFYLPAPSITLSDNIIERLGSSVVEIASESNQNWGAVIYSLYNGQGLTRVSSDETSLLIKQIPLDQRSRLLPIIHEMIWDAKIPITKLIYDNTIAAYANDGNTALVQSFIDQMNKDGIQPDHYTYGNLVKCLSKNDNLEETVKAVKEMQAKKIPLSLPIYTTLLQTCIRVKDYAQAFDVFDMLKFLGTSTQPDVPIYNSVMIAASKMHNINRVLDLYNEMTTRPIDPLQPNITTYAVLIYACARDEQTHVKAWHLLMEMYEKGFAPDRQTLNAMLYLCGNTGELSFARSIFRQMCVDPVSYPDSFSLNCLLTAYSNYKPGFLSPVLSTALGPKLRAAFFFNLDIPATTPVEISPPFLPYPMISNKLQVLAESRAIFNFFKDIQFNTDENSPQGRARKILNPTTGKINFINERTVLRYLSIPINLDNEAEYRYRWERDTCVAPIPEEDSPKALKKASSKNSTGENIVDDLENKSTTTVIVEDEKPSKTSQDDYLSRRIPRNHYMYDLAITGHIKNNWPYNHARGVWESRGEWRRNNLSVYRTSMKREDRHKSDFLFARRMVEYLSMTKKLQDAVDIVTSSLSLFRWRKHHVEPILAVAQEIEDNQTIRKMQKITSSYHRK